MQRDPNLHPLSEHHHHVLVLALEIRRAAESSAPDRSAKLREAAKSLLRFWDQAGKTHFEEEEQILLPKYARHFRLDEDPDIMRMLADHAAIRARMEDLNQDMAEIAEGAPCLAPEPVIELGRMLHDHVRLEEDSIFPRIEKALSELEMRSLGSRLTRLHEKK